ncbi:MAG: hypothetical protein JNL04_12795 [Rhodospirillaceae bacterium]|nr:hypothetical protein [Rhodospirillaceae bacterium]
MTAFLDAVLDTLLPGVDGLPSGSRVGLDPAAHAEALRVIGAEAGGDAAFVAASTDARSEILRRVETRPAFQALAAAALTRYYQSEAVVTAMGWRLAPPQPTGHKVAATDAATWERLEKVKARTRIWR